MAKVKITGHASGTGIFTVTAPNSSTDRTITLPDATGTLLNSDGSAASLTAIPAANITGTLPAINGASLTGLFDPDGAVTINDSGGEHDFRIESDSKTHQLHINGSTGKMILNATDSDTTQSSLVTLMFQSAVISAFAGRMTDDGSGAGFLVCRKSDGATIGQVARNGTTDAVHFLTSSDYRLKENVNYTFDATTLVKQLKPCRFTWIADESNNVYEGFLAHELQEVIPHAVVGEKDAVDAEGNIEAQSMDKSDIVPLLVKTIQELEARITALEA